MSTPIEPRPTSEAQLAQAIRERLRRSYVDPSEVEVTLETGTVRLAGFVHSERLRKQVPTILRDVLGAYDLENELVVK